MPGRPHNQSWDMNSFSTDLWRKALPTELSDIYKVFGESENCSGGYTQGLLFRDGSPLTFCNCHRYILLDDRWHNQYAGFICTTPFLTCQISHCQQTQRITEHPWRGPYAQTTTDRVTHAWLVRRHLLPFGGVPIPCGAFRSSGWTPLWGDVSLLFRRWWVPSLGVEPQVLGPFGLVLLPTELQRGVVVSRDMMLGMGG